MEINYKIYEYFNKKQIRSVLKLTKFLIKKYNIKNEEVAFLSANTWDVSGGGNYGFTSIWVNRNNNIFDNLDYKPIKQITGLNQLLDIL